jgi:hypothetical protein
MSHEDERAPRPRHTQRTRLLMAGAFLGALLAVSFSFVFSWPVDVGEQQQDQWTGTANTASHEEQVKRRAFNAPVGSCLTWTEHNGSDMRVVSCEQPHFFEVTGVEDVSHAYPDGAPSPDLAQWREIAVEQCTAGAEDYLDKPLDPEGKLQVTALRPGEDDWGDGERELRCGLQWVAPGGAVQAIHGPAVLQEQSDVWDEGTCLALTGKTVGDPIDCAEPHSYEMIAVLDLSDEFGEDYPSEDDQMTWLDTECSKLADDYTGELDLAAEKLTLTWDIRSKESWEAGSYLVNCKVGARLEDGSGLAPVTGSVKEGERGKDPGADGGEDGAADTDEDAGDADEEADDEDAGGDGPVVRPSLPAEAPTGG